MDAKYGDKARGGSLGLSLRLPRRRGSGTGTAVRRTICALLAFALLVYLPLRSIAGGSSSAALGGDCGPVATPAGDEPAPADLRSLVGDDGNLDDRRFTVLLNTFKRPDLLKKAVAHYATCPDVAEIRVVWSEQTAPPTRDDEAGAFFGPKPSMVTYDAHPTTSIQNRFDPPAAGAKQISTTAVFNVDEDVRMPCAALSAGFKAWRANADVLVGYYPRTHVPDATGCGWRYVWDDLSLWRHGDFSIVLTKAAFMRTGYMSLYAQGLPDGGETVHRRAQELRGHRHANLDGESHGQAAGVRPCTHGALPMGKVGGVRRGGDQQRERAPRPQGRVHHASVRNHRWRRADVDAAGQSPSGGVGRVGHGDSVMNMNARTRIRY